MIDVCKDYGIPCDPNAQQLARDEEVGKFLAVYRERMKDYQPSAEEKAEMRAAFGAGATVINIVTGQRTTV